MPDSDFWNKVKKDHSEATAVAALLRSNAELRAALILAGKEIVKLNFGKKNTSVLNQLRETLREARAVEKRILESRRPPEKPV
jgi:hypothetical protein